MILRRAATRGELWRAGGRGAVSQSARQQPPPEGSTMQDDATMKRLDCQIDWYDGKSGTNQRCYKAFKVIVFIVAALIPLLSGVQVPVLWVPVWVLGAMGAAIAVIESVQQLYQFHGNWISYRSTCEALKHEKYLYLAKARPYVTAMDMHALLAERVESLVSQENAKWASAQEIANRRATQQRDTDGDRAGARPDVGQSFLTRSDLAPTRKRRTRSKCGDRRRTPTS
jgi:hypothetical protein